MKHYKVFDWTKPGPQCGKWSVWELVASHPGGPALTITGQIVTDAPPTGMWQHVSGVPWFNTENEAKEAMFGLRHVEVV